MLCDISKRDETIIHYKEKRINKVDIFKSKKILNVAHKRTLTLTSAPGMRLPSPTPSDASVTARAAVAGSRESVT